MSPKMIILLAVAGAALTLASSPARSAQWDARLGVVGRAVSVDGDRSKYRQHLNLDDGIRLQELVVRGRRSGRGPDRIDVSMYHLGGEPSDRIVLRIQDTGRYKAAYERRRSEYRYDDIIVLPEDASATGSTGGDFQRFNFDRVQHRGDLDVQLNDRATLSYEFRQLEKRGRGTTVRSVQREEFELDRTIDERDRSHGMTLSYRWDDASVAVGHRRRDYDNDFFAILPAFSPGSLPEGLTELAEFSLTQPVSHESREDTLQVRLRPRIGGGRRAEVSLDALRTTLDGRHRIRETALGSGFTGAPLQRDVAGGGDLSRDGELLKLHGRYPLTDAVRLVGEVRRHRVDQDGDLVFDGDMVATDWRIDRTGAQLGVEAAVSSAVFVSAGVIREEREQRFRPMAAGPASIDQRTRHDGYFTELAWRPAPAMKLRVSAEAASIDDPFTLSSPTDRRRLQLEARYRWNDAVTVLASHRYAKLENDNSAWQSRSRQSRLQVDYSGERLGLTLGATRMDTDREVEQTVIAGTRSVFFDIDYAGKAAFYDAAVNWRATESMRFGGNVRRYRNRGSFEVERDDYRAFLVTSIDKDHDLSLTLRRTEFEEGGIEEYAADIIELAVTRTW